MAIDLANGFARTELQVQIVNDVITENIERFRVELSGPSFIPSGVVHEETLR